MSFVHEDGKFFYNYLASLKVDKIYELGISFSGSKTIFYINGLRLGEYTFKKEIFGKIGYYLHPYFGGGPSAPHFMKIYLKELS